MNRIDSNKEEYKTRCSQRVTLRGKRTQSGFILLLFCFFFSAEFFGQNETNYWYFGRYAGLDFTCSPPVPLRSGMYHTTECCASISDSMGSLLFYTNGDSVFDRSHQMMMNGFAIGNNPNCWGSTTQGALILPKPSSASNYFIFTIDCADNNAPSDFRYSVVDMSGNGGLGEVVLKDQLLLSPVTEKLAAYRHSNEVDYWVVVHEHGTNAFYSYLVTENGINDIPVVSNAGQIHWLPGFSYSMSRGYMKFSPNGQKLVVLSISDQHSYGLYPEIFFFNNSTGVVEHNFTVEDSDSTNYYGASFSPDNNLLYLSSGWKGKYVHQFNANTNNSIDFLASKEVIYYQPPVTTDQVSIPGALQIASDGKIYLSTHKAWIDIIHNPNVYGEVCNYEMQAINLTTCPSLTSSHFGLPNFPESNFQFFQSGASCSDTLVADFNFEGLLVGEPTQFMDESWGYPDTVFSHFWNFGDEASGANNSSVLMNPSHTYQEPGTYLVTLYVSTDFDTNCKTDSISKEILIEDVTGVFSTLNVNQGLRVFPNPFDNFLFLENTEMENQKCDLFDTCGKLIKSYKIEQSHERIAIGQELTPGIYFLRIKSDSEISTIRLIKAR